MTGLFGKAARVFAIRAALVVLAALLSGCLSNGIEVRASNGTKEPIEIHVQVFSGSDKPSFNKTVTVPPGSMTIGTFHPKSDWATVKAWTADQNQTRTFEPHLYSTLTVLMFMDGRMELGLGKY